MFEKTKVRTASVAVLAVLASVSAAVVTTAAPASAAVVGPGGDFVALPTTPIIGDTRSGTGFPKAKVGPTAVDLTVALPGVDMANVSAVLLQVITVAPAAPSYLSVFPNGGTANGTSAVNFVAGVNTSNTVAVAVPANRKVSFVAGAGATDVVVGAEGYYTAATGASGPGGFVSVTHSRVLNTRTGVGAPAAKVAGNGGTLTLDLSSVVPAGTPSAYLDFIVADATGTGYVRVGSGGSIVQFGAGNTAQGVAVPLNAGKVTFTVQGSSAALNLVATLEGYTAPTTTAGGAFRAVQTRLLAPYHLAPGATVDVQVGGRNGLPLTGIAGAALNIIAANTTAAGYLAVYPTGSADPGTSISNHEAKVNRADFVVVGTGTDGKVTVANHNAAALDVVVDQYGWFDAQTTVVASRKFTPTAAVQLPANPGDTTAARPIVYSWVDENGELHVSQQDDPADISSIKTVSVPANQQVRGPVSLGLVGTTSVQASVQGANTDALTKNGPLDSRNITQWQTTPYVDFGGSMASAPVIATNPDGSLTLFAVDSSGALWRCNESDASRAWARVPGAPVLTSAFSVLTTSRGVQIAAAAADKTVSTALYSSGVMSAWTSLGGSNVVERPAIVAQTGGLVRVVVRQGTKVLTKAQVTDGTFASGWTALTAPAGTTLIGAPAGVLDPATGRNVITVRATDTAQTTSLYVVTETGQSAGTYGGWAPISGTDGVGTDPTVLIYRTSNASTFEIVWRDSLANALRVSVSAV